MLDNDNVPEVMGKRDVAEFLKVSQRTVDLWRERYGLPAFRLGAVIRFDRGAVWEWFQRFTEKKGV